jgi:hypothetical protein
VELKLKNGVNTMVMKRSKMNAKRKMSKGGMKRKMSKGGAKRKTTRRKKK